MISQQSSAKSWREASPLGNGRLGAMVLGGVEEEVIHLNEETLWSGEPQAHHDGAQSLAHLSKVRKLIAEGKHQQATDLGNKTLLGKYNQCYLPMGQLKIVTHGLNAGTVKSYSRTLNLNNAISQTKFESEGVAYQREVIISHPDNLVVVHYKASESKALHFTLSLDSLLEHETQCDQVSGSYMMSGRAPIHADPHYLGKKVTYDGSPSKKGMRFVVEAQAESADGEVLVSDKGIEVKGATDVVIKLTAATSFNGYKKSPSAEGRDPRALTRLHLDRCANRDYAKLKNSHVEAHQALFSRVDLQLGNTDRQGLPLEGRIGGNYVENDVDLDELFYQFGRYLLIGSSRVGGQAANLQGIWSYKINPSWSSNYTINCNAQFNYIGAGAAHLPELCEPFLNLIEEGADDGAKVAKSWYGTDGWVIHHNLDLWRSAMPVAGSVLWATFPMGGTWSVVELYDQWKFDQDLDRLERIHKLQQGSVDFWLANLQESKVTGELVSSPDVYFENTAKKTNGETVVLCSGPVSSAILIRQLFIDYLEVVTSKGDNEGPRQSEVRAALLKMPRIRINEDGEIRQWFQDFDDNWSESDSTQLLVMVGAIYSNQIHPRLTPPLANALKNMLERRKNGPDGQGSWRAAFPANTYARLGDGERCVQVIEATMKKWINPNLTTRFIQSDWQIDGNLGLMSSIQECLLQSHAGEIELLPALPEKWSKQGAVRGLKARGGYTADFSWEDGKVIDFKISGGSEKSVDVRVNGALVNTQAK